LGGKEKKGAKLRIGLYIEYDPQANISDYNRLKIKKTKSSFLSNALRYPEEHCFLEVPEASLFVLLVAAVCG
jgi:hypothetical protein